MSLNIIRANSEKVFQVLEENCQIKEKDLDDADTRKYAVKSYNQILVSLLEDNEPTIDSAAIDKFFKAALNLMNDYTTDKRGDIGSIVRESSMYSMMNVLKTLANKRKVNKDYPIQVSENVVHGFVSALLKQLVEKIDRTRLIAGSILQELVDSYLDDLPSFKGVDKIKAALNKGNIQKKLKFEQERLDENFSLAEEMKGKNFATISTQQMTFDDVNLANTEGFVYYWNLPHCVYPLITPLLEYPEFSSSVVHYQQINNFTYIF